MLDNVGSSKDVVFKENSTNLMDRKKNKEVLHKAEYSRSLLNTVHTRQLKFFGHLMQVKGLEKSPKKRDEEDNEQSLLTVSTGSLETWL